MRLTSASQVQPCGDSVKEFGLESKISPTGQLGLIVDN